MSPDNIRGMAGELRDLKRRFSAMTDTLGYFAGVIESVLEKARAGEHLSAKGVAVLQEKYNAEMQKLAEALGTTVEELRR